MLTSTARLPVPYMHSVKPSQVLPGLSIWLTVSGGGVTLAGSETCFASYQAAPPTNARRRNDDEGSSKNITAAPSKKAIDNMPDKDRQRSTAPPRDAATGACFAGWPPTCVTTGWDDMPLLRGGTVRSRATKS